MSKLKVHRFMMRGMRFKVELRGILLIQRVFGGHNELPKEVKIGIVTFKRHLDGYLNEQGIERSGINADK